METPSGARAASRVSCRARAWICASLVLAGCHAQAARYVIVDSQWRTEEQDTPLRRLVCLSEQEARANAALLGLRTTSSIEEYAHQRHGGGATETVLFQLVSGDYGAAEETLRTRGAEIPAYLRSLLEADLVTERSAAISVVSPAELMKLYQAAYDAQENDKARTIVKLRVRQLRYAR
jgi:hypothetical protein